MRCIALPKTKSRRHDYIKKITAFCICITILVTCAKIETGYSDIANLNDQDIVDLIKINILFQHGGAELERKSVCNAFSSMLSKCNFDTTMTLNLGNPNTNYELDLSGDFTIDCSEKYEEKDYEFNEEDSTIGISTMGEISQEFSHTHNTLITANQKENDYTIQGKGFRSINYTSSTFKNLEASLHFNYINFFNYNMEDCAFKGDTHYNFRFKVRHNYLATEDLSVTGSIHLEEDEWVLKSDDGIYAVLY